MPDFTLSLGGYVFAGFELPEKMPFGVEQQLKVHKFIGGARRIHAMGRDDPPIEWSGRFRGADAVSRALNFKAMALAAESVPLIWDQCAYTVVIRRFHADEAKFYEVPYSIAVEVLTDDAFPDPGDDNPSPQQQLGSDSQAATAQADAVGDPTLSDDVDGATTQTTNAASGAARPADIATDGDTSIPSGSGSVQGGFNTVQSGNGPTQIPSGDAPVGNLATTGNPAPQPLDDGTTMLLNLQ